jgi:hypothetical protein
MLRDTGQSVNNLIGALGRKPGDIDTGKEGFSVRVYTPVAWLHQLSANAAKEYRTLTPETLPEGALQPVVRVKVYPDTPHSVVAGR